MATYSISTTAEQEVALTNISTNSKLSNQEVLIDLVTTALNIEINSQKQNYLDKISKEPLSALEVLSEQVP